MSRKFEFISVYDYLGKAGGGPLNKKIAYEAAKIKCPVKQRGIFYILKRTKRIF